MDSSRKPSVLGVLSEAISIPARNKKLMIPAMLLAFLPSSCLQIGNYISIYPLLLNFIIKLYHLGHKHPGTPQFYGVLVGLKKDAEALINADIVFMISSYIVSIFSMLLIIHSSAMTYSGKQLTMKDLLLKIKQRWKGPFLTRVYFTLLRIGYTILSVSSISVFLIKANGLAGLIMIGSMLAVLSQILYVYLAMVWMMGVVISVLDEACHGLEALGKAGELVKGRTVQGLLIAFFLLFLETILTVIYSFGAVKVHGRVGVSRACAIAILNVLILLKMYSQMVYTVFYYECKKTRGKGGAELGHMTYTTVPIVEAVP